MASVLLVEPDYPTRFPPLGLLKIGAYHRQKGDTVRLVRGKIKDPDFYDRVYVTTLFSFHHKLTIDTIKFYKQKVFGDLRRIRVGGIYASLFPKVIYKETGIYPHVGLLDRAGILDADNVVVDALVPDYSLLDDLNYDYGLQDCYIGYATRGCPNQCPFCAVPRLEPQFVDSVGLYDYFASIRDRFGEKQNLVLMDNNVLASKRFAEIIDDILRLGFEKGAKRNKRKRFVDFNQGLDASLITPATAKLLALICIDPLRLAYDYAAEKVIFAKAITAVAESGVGSISTYMLYNFRDTPDDLYKRLRHVIDLNRKYGLQIYSFPMRYTPLDHKDRTHVGPYWTRREIRGIQCVINVTKGLVSHRPDLFLRAFGNSPQEMQEIVWMPDRYILQRDKHEDGDAKVWRKTFATLSEDQRAEFKRIVGPNDVSFMQQEYAGVRSKRVKTLLDAHLAGNRCHHVNTTHAA